MSVNPGDEGYSVSVRAAGADPHGGATELRLTYEGGAPTLSDLLPMLENLGFRVLEQSRTAAAATGSTDHFYVHDARGVPVDVETYREVLEDALAALLAGGATDDGLNRLVLYAGLDLRQVKLLRLYSMYYTQINPGTGRSAVVAALATHPELASTLANYFAARFDPAVGGVAAPNPERDAACRAAEERFVAGLGAVRSLAEDKVLRGLLDLVKATVRTNYYLGYDRVSIKIDSHKVATMPEPRPLYEIAMLASGVEGAHLRGGLVARGGIRWSDRPADFRTEVLGLLKTQTTKNAVIVPVGSKGGFVLRNAPSGPELQEYVKEQYKTYIRSLLDVTDNLTEGGVVHPEGVVIYDGDDPYLVVAADKGTARFSDVANAMSAEYGYWLGDAFASGGSAGYDHKGMGITARGAWEAAKRHFAELGLDVHKDTFTVAGIGDMAGDVFGNGMLYSDKIRLQAAFNHLHVFLDPDPDPGPAYEERKRLFALPRSSWADYDPSVISEGGGVFERASKSIFLSPQVKEMLGVTVDSLSGQDLIQAVLRMPVDMLYNGGIGTYVKSADERHAEVGDSANDGVRVDGRDLRARVVVEGGNLGFTQRGRIEYALAGGRIDTDAIDNSAGVDSSDHEVNIKILLQPLVAGGELAAASRKELLAEMEGEVARLVLRHNFDQTRALSLAQRTHDAEPALFQSLLHDLETSAGLDAAVEFLPTDRELADRRREGLGFTRPELAVMLAYVKMGLYDAILASDLPEEPQLAHYLHDYFPQQVRERYPEVIERHRLKREITATVLTNTIVDELGVAFVHRAQRDNGADAVSVARATLTALELLDAKGTFATLRALGGVDVERVYGLLGSLTVAVQDVVSWLLANDLAGGLGEVVEEFAGPASSLRARLKAHLPEAALDRYEACVAELQGLGIDAAAASDLASLPLVPALLGAVEAATEAGAEPTSALIASAELGEALSLDWLDQALAEIAGAGSWEKMALHDLRTAARAARQELTVTYLRSGGRDAEAFLSAADGLSRYRQYVAGLRESGDLNLASASVVVGALGKVKRQLIAA